MKTTSIPWLRTVILAVTLFVFLSAKCFAAYPPVLVINGVVCTGSASPDNSYSSYSTGGYVIVLFGASGGTEQEGSDLNSALNQPLDTGTWDGGMNFNTSSLIIAPQVVIYYPSAVTPAPLLGYDGVQHQSIGSGTASNAEFMVAYNGLPDGYIFTFGSETPIYRYQAGTSPVTLDTTHGWPPSNVVLLPSQIAAGTNTLNLSSYTSGLTNGYWANAYYAETNGSGIYGELHVYIAPDGSGGQLYGNFNGQNVSANWDSSISSFVASPGLGVSYGSPPNSSAVGWPQNGPPQVEYNGDLLPFAFNDVGGNDVYWDSISGTWVTINSSGAVSVSDGTSYTYSPATQMFSGIANLAAISADGTAVLGNDGTGALEIYGPFVSSVQDSGGNVYNPNFSYQLTNGTWVTYFDGAGNWLGPVIFNSQNTSPLYSTPSGGQIKVINAVDNWPPTDTSSVIPSAVNVNGVNMSEYTFCTSINIGEYGSGGNADFNVTQSEGGFNVTGNLDDGTPYYFSGSGAFSPGSYYDGVDGVSVNIGFSSAASPSYGPVQIYWNGNTYAFAGNTNGVDTYTNSQDSSQITINSQYQVTETVSGKTGTYSSGSMQFSISRMLAQDGDGNLLGVSPGLVISSGTLGPIGSFGQGGESILLQDGSTRSATYTIQRNDGTWFTEYLGLPNNSLVWVQDASENYSSPAYHYAPVNGTDVIIDTSITGDWPVPKSFYSPSLYINGHLATLDARTAVDAGTSGSATYRVQPNTGDSFTLNWSFNSSFQGTVSGSYLGTSWTDGTWDGGNLFGNLPSGIIISTTPPPGSARFGPQQIVWDGVQLTFNSLASSITPSNPTGGDVYQDSLGLGMQVIVGSNGTATASQLDGSTFTGTYTASNQQFNFSNSAVGSVNAANNQGFSYPGNGGSTPSLTQATTDVAGNLDVHGNTLTLGNWTDTAGNSVEAFGLAFTPAQGTQPNTFDFISTLHSTQWTWSQATSAEGSAQAVQMVLTPNNVLELFSPDNVSTPAIILNPGADGTAVEVFSPDNRSTPAIILNPGGHGTPPSITVSAPSGDIPTYNPNGN